MTRSFNAYVEIATEEFEAGFTSKAAQKRALDALNRAARMVQDETSDALLSIDRDERAANWNDLYYSFPDLHNWKARHATIYAEYPFTVDSMNFLSALREAIKGATIKPPVRSETAERIEQVRKSVIEIMEARRETYLNAVEMGEKFGGLPVTVNAHWVVNQHGTKFLRYFFFLRGKLTPLNVLIAAHEEIERRKEAK